MEGVGHMKQYRHFEEDFKRDVVARIDSGAMTKAQVAREHNISSSLIDRWQVSVESTSPFKQGYNRASFG